MISLPDRDLLLRMSSSGTLMRMDVDELIAAAIAARALAYAPYSNFAVGAAILGSDGRIFTGCNIENLSFGLTVCAERVALGTAVAAGIRAFEALAVVADTNLPVSPCGACRQVLSEFNEDLVIWLATLDGERVRFSLRELFPRGRTGILDRPASA